MQLTRNASRLLRSARVAHLATADSAGNPLVIPICFVFDGKRIYSPIDEKPKHTSPQKLKRLNNIRENSQVSLVIDRWDEDWRKLAYILVSGQARILLGGQKHRKAISLLRRKYRQYRSMALEERPMIVIEPRSVKIWGNL